MDRPIAFVVNHVAFFVSHRLPLALGARAAGYRVCLLTGQPGSASMESAAEAELAQAGIAHFRSAFRSDGVNPVRELRGLAQLAWQVIARKPRLLHCASPKGLLYGGIVARLCGVPAVVLAVSGMGYAFTRGQRASLHRAAISAIFRAMARFAFGHRNLRVIVQNQDDLRNLVGTGWVREDQMRLIPGSGVELERFLASRIEFKQRMVLLPARMLVDKGVYEFVEAARRVRAEAPDWRFVMAGAADYGNPTSVPLKQLQAWLAEGVVEWLGHVNDMEPLFDAASIVCLPSYREGMPKCLLEAAAAGSAVVTTDTIGCREAVLPGRTGLLVPVQDAGALAAALITLVRDREMRERFGREGRVLAIERFDVRAVVRHTLRIYEELLSHR